ncbi:NmrA family NAD(P)-binding protein [Streptomyces mirabilis]
MTATDSLFLITGATGNTGAPTVKALREEGHRVRAFVHTLDERSDRLKELGAEIVAGDVHDFAALSAAMADVRAAYFCYPLPAGRLLDATAVFAEAAIEAGVEAVVNMSQMVARRDAPSPVSRQHWLAERLLDRTPMMITHLRSTLFLEWVHWCWQRTESEGVLRTPFAHGRHAPLLGPDHAAVIAAILTKPDLHQGQSYRLTGPAEVDHRDIAAEVGQSLGIPVRYEPVSVDAFTSALTAAGLPKILIEHIAAIAQDYHEDFFAGSNNLVEVIGGHRPTTVGQYVASVRDTFDHSGRFALPQDRLTA